jgi:hypothetical protein
MSRTLNSFFSRGLQLPFRDMSSVFRLYKAAVIRGETFAARNFAIWQDILVRGYAQGWKIQEIAFHYAPRNLGKSAAQLFGFGMDYLKALRSLWGIRNSNMSADYDSRFYECRIIIKRIGSARGFGTSQN